MTVDLNKPAGHARWCSGGCPRWIATGAPTCLPTPCQCEATKAAAPEWARDRCWWKDKKTLKIKSRCPCWGARRDGRPADCCALHLANPQYLDVRAATFLAMSALTDPNATKDAQMTAPGADEPDERPDTGGLWDDWDDMPPNPYEVVRMPYAARWTREELHCDCSTPFDSSKTSTGWHCPGEGCHQNFRSWQVGSMHRRFWTDPCRPPDSLVDVDTGDPLMRQDAQGVWGVIYG